MAPTNAVKRALAAASAVGAVVFIGLFAWSFLVGILPLELAILLSIPNVIVCYFSVDIFRKLQK